MRVGALGITLVSLGIWSITGFNIVEGAVPFIGIQWSTFATFSFFFYLLMVNFQVGGLRSFKQLGGGMAMDLHFMTTLKRREYPKEFVVNPWRAVIMSVLACVSALFLFEVIWVFLYDGLQFGSVMWPVYFAVTPFPGVLVRNVGLFVMPLVLFWMLLDLGLNEVRLKFRLDYFALSFGFLAVAFWAGWVAFPHQNLNVYLLTNAQIIGPQAGTFSLANCYVFPAQNFFPQNTYTFYPCALYGVHYTPPQILGFFDSDPWVHAVNVLTKFVTFGALCYPAMAIARGRN